MIGNASAVIAKPIDEIATLASEKLRSRNRGSGTSGSLLVAGLPQTKTDEHHEPGDDQAPARVMIR